jgi:hypothetical protein
VQDKFARDGWQQEWRNGYEKQGWDSRASETREKNSLKDSADWQSYWSQPNGAQIQIASEADHEQNRFTVSANWMELIDIDSLQHCPLSLIG